MSLILFEMPWIRAVVANYVVSESSENDLYLTKVTDQLTGETKIVKSKVIINACGPHADAYNQQNKQLTVNKHLFSKGASNC